MGDSGMSNEQLGAETGIIDQERKDSATHAAAGLGVDMTAGVVRVMGITKVKKRTKIESEYSI